MPYYHVRIVHHDPSRKRRRDAYELDLSKEELMERIVGPYLTGKTFMCGGQPIDAFFINLIKVSESDEASSTLIPKLRTERAAASFRTGIIAPVSDEYLVVENSRNVTRELISHPPVKEEISEKPEVMKSAPSKNVFIVHGRDHKPIKELKAMLRKFGLNPIVLHEQPSGSRTIVEKLEKYSDVGYAFIVLTPDDIGCDYGKYVFGLFPYEKGKLKLHKTSLSVMKKLDERLKRRARQNVVLEFGYFIGLLGRDRVCCLYRGNIELPSDMHGIVYISFEESVAEVRGKIIKELKAAGYKLKV